MDVAPEGLNRNELLIQTSEMLSAFLGVTLVIVGT
jgi:hypothetical protein